MYLRKDLETRHSDDPEFIIAFEQAFTCKLLFSNCIVSSNFEPPEFPDGTFVLTEQGNDLLESLRFNENFIDDSHAKLAIFLQFYFSELLIDCKNCNLTPVFQYLETEIKACDNIRFPWVFDRELYDRYFDHIGSELNELSLEQTNLLLDGTSQGVFQVGKKVIGPFGLLESVSSRRLLPTRTPPLRHCSDLSCRTLHGVELATATTTVSTLLHEITKFRTRERLVLSEWFSYFANIIGNADYYDDFNSLSFPWFLANGFTDAERARILAHAIDNFGREELRAKFPSGEFSKLFRNDGQGIVSTLNKPQVFQLLLLADNQMLISSIESLVFSKQITIPATQVRQAKFERQTASSLDISVELSRLGVRFDSKAEYLGVPRLEAMIKAAYRDHAESLDWKLRKLKDGSRFEKLSRHLSQEPDVREILREFLFSDEKKLRQALSFLSFEVEEIPNSAEKENLLIDQMLWKLGFEVPLYPEFLSQFSERGLLFREAFKKTQSYSRNNKEDIRSTGVNYFVSVEELLDYALSFTTWMLLSDHYADTNYEFEISNARKFMAGQLDGRNTGAMEPIRFESDRQNTLFPMIKGFELLADLCEEILERSSKFLRPAKELPSYLESSRLFDFPFKHTALIADTNTNQRLEMLKSLREITRLLESGKVCDVRNRIEHKRDEFPSCEEIEKAYDAIETALKVGEKTGILPTVYLKATSTMDRFGRGKTTMKNFRGDELKIPSPSKFRGLRLPSLQHRVIIVPSITIGESIEPVRFRFVELSDYNSFWKNYPRREPDVPQNSDRDEVTMETYITTAIS